MMLISFWMLMTVQLTALPTSLHTGPEGSYSFYSMQMLTLWPHMIVLSSRK